VKRQSILKKIEETKKNKMSEGFGQFGLNEDNKDYAYIQKEIKQNSINKIEYPTDYQNIPTTLYDLPLKQFCIKGSYNSSFSGKYISDDMIKYVLSRGCRFLDFEVYYSETDGAYVGYSSDSQSVSPLISNDAPVSLNLLLKQTLSFAFSGGFEISNINDPLFVQLRLKTEKETRPQLYSKISETINGLKSMDAFSSYFYNGNVNGNTPISKLMKKVVIVFEDDPDMPVLHKNMISNTNALMKRTYSEMNPSKFIAMPPKKISTNETNVVNFTMVVPDKNKSSQPNVNIFSSINKYGVQISLMQYYVYDTMLLENEKLFKHYNGSYVPMSYCIEYVSDNEDNSNIIFPSIFKK
jgi:hypothetical protein